MPYRSSSRGPRLAGRRPTPAAPRLQRRRARRDSTPLSRFRTLTWRLARKLAAKGLPAEEQEGYRHTCLLAAQFAAEGRLGAAVTCLDAGREYGAGMAEDGAGWGRDLGEAYEEALVRFARAFLKRRV